MNTAHHAARESSRRTIGAALLSLATACSEGFRAFGPNPVAAEVTASQMLGALAARYNPVERDPRYDAARVKIAKAALIPSRIWDDTGLWTARPTPTSRAIHIQGGLAGQTYRLEARPSLGPAGAPGDSRHSITLHRLGESTFQWDTQVAFALGSITAAQAGAAFSALLSAGDAKSAADLRADYRTAFPRAAAAFGRGFSVDSLDVAPSGPGLTSVMVTIAFHPERLSPTFPAFTAYLDKYLRPARYHFTLVDRTGATMFDIDGRDRAMTLRYRVDRDGLVSLTGLPRPLGDTLQLRADVSLKVKLFTVAFRNLTTDFVITRAPHERAWAVIAKREPEWDLPLVTERLIRSSLRRPFEGEGALLRLSVRDTAGGQTMFMRQVRLAVQESAILRFIGSLGAHMMGDISKSVEGEEYRFLREGFAGFVADVHALGGRPGPRPPSP